MPPTNPTKHNEVLNTALPYSPNDSVVSDKLCYRAGSNVMTSIRGYAEKRPGFTATAANISAFYGTRIDKRFLWNRWDGTFYEMLTTDWGSLFKREIGTDVTFQGMSLFGSDSAQEPDFAVASDYLFINSGTFTRKWDGDSTGTMTSWGFLGPARLANAPLVPTLVGGALTATKGYRYVAAWGDSVTGHISSPSPLMITPTVPVAQNVTFTVGANPDYTASSTDVDEFHLYRTADGGSIYFEHPNSPISYATWIASGFTDSAADNTLTSQVAPLQFQNDPPPDVSNGLVWNAGRLWIFAGDKVYFSGWEEIPIGTSDMPEACFPPDNYFPFGEQVIGLAVAHDPSEQGVVMVFCAGSIHTISGDTLDTFKRSTIARRRGCRNRRTITDNGKIVAWLDTSNTVQISDGHSMQEISIPIRPDIQNIDHSLAQMAFYDDGLRHWLVLVDGGAGKLYVYDQDLEQWLPPWDIDGVCCVSSGESAPGIIELYIGRDLSPWEMDPTVFTDDGDEYAGSLTLGLKSIAEDPGPDSRGYVDYISAETNAALLTDVGVCYDEEPLTATFTSLAAYVRNPPYRTNGANLVEKQYPTQRGPVARRCSAKFDWAADSEQFKLFSFDIAYREQR